MRKQKPFARNRMLKNGNNNNNSMSVMNNNTLVTATSIAGGDYGVGDISKISSNNTTTTMFNGQRDRLTDGINNITKSILQQRGVSGNAAQLEQQDDIPLRPLLLNGNQNPTINSQSPSRPNE